MDDVYFVAYNESTKYYLRRPSVESENNRPKFSASGEIVRFESAFSAFEFFRGSRFDTTPIRILKVKTDIVEQWSLASLEEKHEVYFA